MTRRKTTYKSNIRYEIRVFNRLTNRIYKHVGNAPERKVKELKKKYFLKPWIKVDYHSYEL